MEFEDKIKQRYTGAEGEQYHQRKRSIPDKAYPWVAKLRGEKIHSYINKTDTVLEYGVGTGWNLAELDCKRKLGFDLSEHLEPVVRCRGIEFVKDIKSIADASVDVVICHHVLEHTSNPPEILKEIRRILADSGKLLLFVPYEKERRYRRFNPQEPNHHLYSWNVQTLGNLVGDFGFTIEQGRVLQFGYDRIAAVWAVRLGLGESGFRLIRKAGHLVAPALEVCIIANKN
ncbi:MAG: class I SAM-dependent methyltransferase [Sedimentisphaerales bacterium]|nr:class I SAM-dependent methyltransferase [Sedimentisphaerales bacterium]